MEAFTVNSTFKRDGLFLNQETSQTAVWDGWHGSEPGAKPFPSNRIQLLSQWQPRTLVAPLLPACVSSVSP